MNRKNHFSLPRMQEIDQRIEEISQDHLRLKISDPDFIILDHFDFMELFKISRRTSQSWRASKKIEYSLISGRLYFRLSDIQKMLHEHRGRRPQRNKAKI